MRQGPMGSCSPGAHPVTVFRKRLLAGPRRCRVMQRCGAGPGSVDRATASTPPKRPRSRPRPWSSTASSSSACEGCRPSRRASGRRGSGRPSSSSAPTCPSRWRRCRSKKRRWDRGSRPAGRRLFGLVDADAELEGMTRPVLAEVYRQRIARAVTAYRLDRDPAQLRQNVSRALVATVAFAPVHDVRRSRVPYAPGHRAPEVPRPRPRRAHPDRGSRPG